MAGAELSGDAWQRIWAGLNAHPGICVGREVPTRQFLEAVLWIARAGAAWRLLPDAFGPVEQHRQTLCPLAGERRAADADEPVGGRR